MLITKIKDISIFGEGPTEGLDDTTLIANFQCIKRLTDKLMLEFEDEILNTTDTISIADKKETCKNICLIYQLLLPAIASISCYYY